MKNNKGVWYLIIGLFIISTILVFIYSRSFLSLLGALVPLSGTMVTLYIFNYNREQEKVERYMNHLYELNDKSVDTLFLLNKVIDNYEDKDLIESKEFINFIKYLYKCQIVNHERISLKNDETNIGDPLNEVYLHNVVGLLSNRKINDIKYTDWIKKNFPSLDGILEVIYDDKNGAREIGKWIISEKNLKKVKILIEVDGDKKFKGICKLNDENIEYDSQEKRVSFKFKTDELNEDFKSDEINLVLDEWNGQNPILYLNKWDKLPNDSKNKIHEHIKESLQDIGDIRKDYDILIVKSL